MAVEDLVFEEACLWNREVWGLVLRGGGSLGERRVEGVGKMYPLGDIG
jgi:hypothetical protein